MSDSKNSDLAFSQVQGNMGLVNMPNLRNLDLIVIQVQGNIGLTNMLNRTWTLPSF